LTKRYRDVASSIFCIVIGVIFCLGATKYGEIWSFPSAAFFPFVGGVILISLSIILLIWTSIGKDAEEDKKIQFFPQKDSVKRLAITLSVLCLYSTSLVYLGFFITTFLFMVLLLKFLEPQKWTTILMIASLTSISAYLLFVTLLQVQLPIGVFGI
jgi:putative tricarboxylic transport membrane protein